MYITICRCVFRSQSTGRTGGDDDQLLVKRAARKDDKGDKENDKEKED
jgi:hypothetical protein